MCTAREVFVSEEALGDPRCEERVQRLLSRVESGTLSVVPHRALAGAVNKAGTRRSLERGGLAGLGGEKRVVVLARLEDGSIAPGYRWDELRSGGEQAKKHGVLCHSAIEIQSVVGCAFDCSYCPYSSFLCVHVDVEHFVERVTALTRARKTQRLYKLNNRSDTLGLEPEYGLAPALVERFAELDGRYLMLYSKGREVDALTGLDHRGKTIASFTLTPEPVAQLMERGAPAPKLRIQAIAKLAAAGYPIRARFSPIVPIAGWEVAYADLIAQLTAVCRPEMLTLWTLSMVDYDTLERVVPLAALDRRSLAAAAASADTMRGKKGAPFPPNERARIYGAIAAMMRDYSPGTAVSLCLETPEVWDLLGAQLVPRKGRQMLCNCGPVATPEALVAIRRACSA